MHFNNKWRGKSSFQPPIVGKCIYVSVFQMWVKCQPSLMNSEIIKKHYTVICDIFFLFHSGKGRQEINTCIGFFYVIACPFPLVIALFDHLQFTTLVSSSFGCCCFLFFCKLLILFRMEPRSWLPCYYIN
jgi:hypothetical protein